MIKANIGKDLSGRIVVSFPYDPIIVSKVKAIEGRRWHPDEKHWSFPNTDSVLEKILKVFGDKEVQIDPALKTGTPKVKYTPSPLVGEGQSLPRTRYGGEGYNFEDLRRELVSRKYSYKTIKDYLYYNKDFINNAGRTHPKSKRMT